MVRQLTLVQLVCGLLVMPATAHGQLDNTKIAFGSIRDGDWEIYLMRPDGTELEQITDHPAADTAPAWSPDGRRIAFASDRDGDTEIFLMNADGSGLTQLTHNTRPDENPAWSPDGLSLTYESHAHPTPEIYRIDADGTNEINLTNHPALDGNPDWSPDGQKIAFHSRRNGTDDVYVMDTDGSNLTRLTFGLWSNWTTWSPDGSQIAFSHGGHVWVMEADGSNRFPLLTVPGSISPAMGDWSPDGAKIVFFTDRFDPDWEVYVMESDGTGLVNLTQDPAMEHWGSWSPILAPRLTCSGFAPPMADYPVTVRGKRALPLKAHVFDGDGLEVTDLDLVASPVVQVWFDSGDGSAVDVTDDALPVGLGDEGNQFVYTDERWWQFNLKTNNYSSPGTYTVFIESGDEAEYGIKPACLTEFVIR